MFEHIPTKEKLLLFCVCYMFDWAFSMNWIDVCFFEPRPSTFAQSAKLRRTAAAKEKELSKCKLQIRFITVQIYLRGYLQLNGATLCYSVTFIGLNYMVQIVFLIAVVMHSGVRAIRCYFLLLSFQRPMC